MKRSGAIDGTGSSSSGGERSVDEEENWGSVPADVTQPLAGAIKGFKSSSAAGRRCDDDAPPPATGPKVSKVVSFNRPHPASPDNIPRYRATSTHAAHRYTHMPTYMHTCHILPTLHARTMPLRSPSHFSSNTCTTATTTTSTSTETTT